MKYDCPGNYAGKQIRIAFFYIGFLLWYFTNDWKQPQIEHVVTLGSL